jgi:hypothetical protein
VDWVGPHLHRGALSCSRLADDGGVQVGAFPPARFQLDLQSAANQRARGNEERHRDEIRWCADASPGFASQLLERGRERLQRKGRHEVVFGLCFLVRPRVLVPGREWDERVAQLIGGSALGEEVIHTELQATCSDTRLQSST